MELLTIVLSVVIIVQQNVWPLEAQRSRNLAYQELKREIMKRSVIVNKIPPNIGSNNSNCDIYLQVFPLDIIQFSDVEQFMTVKLYIATSWTYPDLSWNSSDYEDIESLSLDTDPLWTPVIHFGLTVTENSVLEFPEVVSLNDRGSVTSFKTYHLSFRSRVDFEKYPFDTQCCVASMFMVADGLRLTARAGLFPLSAQMYSLGTEWTFINVTHQQVDRLHRFFFYVRREPTYYVITIIFPLVMTSLMIPLVFLIPAMTGEKLSYLVTIFTSTAIFLNFIWSVMPRGLTSVPYLAIFILEVLMEGCLATVGALIVVNRFEAEEKIIKSSEVNSRNKLRSTRTSATVNVVEFPENFKEGASFFRITNQLTFFKLALSSKILDRAIFFIFYVLQVSFLFIMFCGVGWI